MNKLTDFQDFVMEANARVADSDLRLGQALMTVLPARLVKKYDGGKFDCFYDDALVGNFLNEVYHEFQPKTVEVVVWARETTWNKRHISINCTVNEAKEMDSIKFEDHVVDYINVLDSEPAIEEKTHWDLADMVLA